MHYRPFGDIALCKDLKLGDMLYDPNEKTCKEKMDEWIFALEGNSLLEENTLLEAAKLV